MRKTLVLLFLIVCVTLLGCDEISTTATTTSSQTGTSSAITSTTSGSDVTTTTIITTTAPSIVTTTVSSNQNSVGYSYDKVLASDLMIDLSSSSITIMEVQTYSGTAFADEWVTYVDGKAQISQSYLVGLPLGINYFLISTSSGILELTITISDTRKPEITSPLSVNYQMDTNLVFEYEAYAGSLHLISGNDITEDDYTFDESTFTIDFDYIHSKFTENPERNTLILQVFFNYPEGLAYSFIFIYKP